MNKTKRAIGSLLYLGCLAGWSAQASAQVVATAGVNRQQVALLKWYPANQAASFPVGFGAFAVAFDGAHIWVGSGDTGSVAKLRASDGANLGPARSCGLHSRSTLNWCRSRLR